MKTKAPKKRPTKAEFLPKNLKILIEKEVIPYEVLADPEARQQIGEEPYFIDGQIELDNNLTENAIRPTKLGTNAGCSSAANTPDGAAQ